MRTVGQFTITKWAGGWMADAQVSSNETQAFFSDTEDGCIGKVKRAYAKGIVPMCAVPSDRKVICGRCGQDMDNANDAEGCEDPSCPIT